MIRVYNGRVTELSGLCISITDCHHSSPKYIDEGEIVIRNYNIKNGKLDLSTTYYTDRETFEYRRSKAIPEYGDIIITREAPIGEVCMVPKDFDCCLGQRMVLLKVDNSKVPSLYLLYALQSEYMQIQIKKSNSTGSIVSNLRLPLLRELSTPIYSFEKMVGIANILSTLDKKIDLNNRINEELESMAKLIYDYWFLQFDFPTSAAYAASVGKPEMEGRPYKSSGGRMVWSEELKREIPEGWGNKCLEEVLAKTSKGSKIKSSEYLTNGIIPIIDQSRDFICGYTNNEETRISTKSNSFVLFGDHTRIVKFINFDFARGADGTQILHSNSSSLPSTLLYQIVNEIDLSNYGYARHFKFLKSTQIIVPSKSAAKGYDSLTSKLFSKIQLNRLENQELSELRDWLLPMLMNGQVRVGDRTN